MFSSSFWLTVHADICAYFYPSKLQSASSLFCGTFYSSCYGELEIQHFEMCTLTGRNKKTHHIRIIKYSLHFKAFMHQKYSYLPFTVYSTCITLPQMESSWRPTRVTWKYACYRTSFWLPQHTRLTVSQMDRSSPIQTHTHNWFPLRPLRATKCPVNQNSARSSSRKDSEAFRAEQTRFTEINAQNRCGSTCAEGWCH